MDAPTDGRTHIQTHIRGDYIGLLGIQLGGIDVVCIDVEKSNIFAHRVNISRQPKRGLERAKVPYKSLGLI